MNVLKMALRWWIMSLYREVKKWEWLILQFKKKIYSKSFSLPPTLAFKGKKKKERETQKEIKRINIGVKKSNNPEMMSKIFHNCSSLQRL